MATATEYSADQLNYYRICFVTTDILADGLRAIFKQVWDKRYIKTKGEWKDEPQNGMDFYNAESRRNQKRNAHLLTTMKKGDRAEWDCTMLFYAILYSDSISCGLSAVVRSNVDNLRKFRNEEFAHLSQGQLSDREFQKAMGKVHVAFQGLRLSTVQIQNVTKQTTFPTKELNDVLNKVEDLKKELQEKGKQNQDLEDKLHEKEEHLHGIEHQLHEKENENQVLEDQLQNDIPPFCILPPKPSHNIEGRINEVSNLAQQLNELKQANEKSLSYLYISGNPGSGKSQLAGLVAKRFFEDAQEDPSAITFVMTLNAESLDTLLESYFSFARQLKCPEYAVTNILQSEKLKTDEKIGHLKTLISTKLKSYTSWLLVADNVKNVSGIQRHLPEPGNEQWARGQLLITTQDTASIPSTSSFIRHISVKKGMEPDDAISLLAILSGIDDSDVGEVAMVARALDYQPLALASAAIYVKELRQRNFGWHNYIEKVKRGQRETTETILAETNPSYPKSMTAATTLAVKEIMASNKVIDHTLGFLSLCAPQPLSLDIVSNYILNVDNEIQDKEQIIMRIQRCSLILLEEENNVLHIGVHQVVRDVIQTLMENYPERLQQKAVNGAVTAFNQFIDDTLSENWQDVDTVLQSKSIAPHLQILIVSIENSFSKENIPQIFKPAILKLGQTCQNHCDFQSAKRYYEYWISIFPEEGGQEDVFVANAYNHLGYIYQVIGEFEQAKQSYDHALNIFMTYLGTEHVHLATTYSNLGSLCEALGNYEQAKEYHHCDLRISQKLLGPEDPEVATTYSNLGSVYAALGDFEQAKEYHQHALDICLNELGPDHVDIATIYSNLGSVYEALGDFQRAKEYYHHDLTISRQKLGPEHPEIATSYSRLGSIYKVLGDFKQAKEYHYLDLNVSLKILGPEHPDVATTYSKLGSVYEALSDLEQAKKYHHRALDIRLKKLGPEHVDVATTYNHFGSVHQALGDFEQAIEYHRCALNIQLKKLGPEHVDVATTYNHLGSVHQALEDFEQAMEYHRRALNIQLEKLGPEHVDVATTFTHFGSVHAAFSDLEQAKQYHHRALDIRQKKLGSDHVDVATSYTHLGSVHAAEAAFCDLEQATEYHHRALDIRLKKLGREHVDVATTYTHLASVYETLGDLELD